MKTIKCYCDDCSRTTTHLVYKDMSSGQRVIMGIVTCGFSELMVDTIYECVSCGETSTK